MTKIGSGKLKGGSVKFKVWQPGVEISILGRGFVKCVVNKYLDPLFFKFFKNLKISALRRGFNVLNINDRRRN